MPQSNEKHPPQEPADPQLRLDSEIGEGVAPPDSTGSAVASSQHPTTHRRLVALEEKTELEFLRRETRLIPSLINFWEHFKWRDARSDPKSKAALTSVLWRFFSPGAAAAAGGGLLLIIQTYLIWKQNEKLDQQTYVMQAQANMGVTAQIGPVFTEIGNWMRDTACIEKEAKCWGDTRPDEWQTWLAECSTKAYCAKILRPNVKDDAELSRIRQVIPLPRNLQSQLVALTQSARPYRFVETDKGGNLSLTAKPLSPERGFILINLVSLGIAVPQNSVLDSAYSVGAKLHGMPIKLPRLKSITLHRADLTYSTVEAEFYNSDLRCSYLFLADLRKSSFLGTDLSGVDFHGARLPNADSLIHAKSLLHADLSGAIVDDPEFLDKLKSSNVQGFDYDRWKINSEGKEYRIISKVWSSRRHEVCPSDAAK